MSRFFEEVAYAARGLRKSLGLATVTTITLALGIGACTAIFSVINAVLLRPLPYSDPQRLVIVWGELRARGVKDWPFSGRDRAGAGGGRHAQPVPTARCAHPRRS